MRNLALVMLLAVLPLTGFAQQQSPAPSQYRPADWGADAPLSTGLSTDQALAIGLGILAGAIGLNIVVGGGAATLVGALAGALIGNWWFERKGAPGGDQQAHTYSATYRQAVR